MLISSSALPRAHHHSAACKTGFFCTGEEVHTPQPWLSLPPLPRTAGSCPFMCHFSLEEVLAVQRMSVLTPYDSQIFCQRPAAEGGNHLSDTLTTSLVVGRNSRVWRKSSPSPSALPTAASHHHFPPLIKEQHGFRNPQQKIAFSGNVINPHLTPYLL